MKTEEDPHAASRRQAWDSTLHAVWVTTMAAACASFGARSEGPEAWGWWLGMAACVFLAGLGHRQAQRLSFLRGECYQLARMLRAQLEEEE